MATSVCVIGIGNVLMGDDGLGPWVLSSLEARWAFPPSVTLVDAGTPGLDLTLFLDGAAAVVAVDAVKAGGAPGEVRTYRRGELLAGELPLAMGAHEPTLRAALLRLELMGRCPRDVLVVGVIPATIAAGTGLSEAVRGALPAVEAQVLRELERLGVAPAPKACASPPAPWWEARRVPCASTAGG